MGTFFSNGCLQTGQFFCHIFAPDFSCEQAPSRMKLARATRLDILNFWSLLAREPWGLRRPTK